jgi:hypothetical protein
MDLRHPSTPDGRLDPGGRLVERYRAINLHLTWYPPTRNLLGTRYKPAAAEVIDVSVSGALLLAPQSRALEPGSIVDLEHDGGRGRVEVRHIHQALDPDQRYYGVLFVGLDQRLRTQIFEVVAKQRGDIERLELAWRTAH